MKFILPIFQIKRDVVNDDSDLTELSCIEIGTQ